MTRLDSHVLYGRPRTSDFGTNLRRVLLNSEVSKKELAVGIGTHLPAIYNYLNSKTQPNYHTIKKIAEFLSIEPGELFK